MPACCTKHFPLIHPLFSQLKVISHFVHTCKIPSHSSIDDRWQCINRRRSFEPLRIKPTKMWSLKNGRSIRGDLLQKEKDDTKMDKAKKNIVVFTVTRPTLFFTADPTLFFGKSWKRKISISIFWASIEFAMYFLEQQTAIFSTKGHFQYEQTTDQS